MTLASEDVSRIDGVPPPSANALRPERRPLIAVAGFFAFKALIGFLILALSAKQLSVSSFATFSQLFLYLALLGSVAAAGVQNGVIREVAAAHGEERIERVFVLGSLVIWACFTGLVVSIAILFRESIAVLLVEDKGYGGTVVILTIVALLAGLGTLLCSALSGSGRAPLSLMIQGLGVAIGGALCLLRLHAGDATGAVLCYAAGPLATSSVALWASRQWLSMRNVTRHEILRVARGLLSYSGTFLVVASALPFVLFGVRYVYRLEFGPVWLGYWLMANRVSDVTTQVIGLYLSQVFLPQATRSPPGPSRLHVIRQTITLGIVVAGIGAGVFALASTYIIPLALSDRYLAASPFILGYLIGDMFRVGGNVALFTALATRKLPLFMAIEVILALLVGAAILAGIAFGYPAASYWGYACAHATAFVIVLTLTRRLSVL